MGKRELVFGDVQQWSTLFATAGVSRHNRRQYTELRKQRLCKPVKRQTKKGKMVYYFTSNTVTPAAYIYVGKDKVESEKFAS